MIIEKKAEKVLFVSSQMGFIANSLVSAFKSKGFEVETAGLSVVQLENTAIPQHIIVLNIDDIMMQAIDVMVFLRNFAVDHNAPLFLVGDPEQLTVVRETIPASSVVKEYIRPVDSMMVADDIYRFAESEDRNHKYKILVVDDDGETLRRVNEWFEHDYHVFLANSGITAIQSMMMNRPDLVLLDYEMPVTNGAKVFEMIKSQPDMANVPVIFLTGKGDSETVKEVMAMNPAGYLLKSLPAAEIIKSIDSFFKKKKLEI